MKNFLRIIAVLVIIVSFIIGTVLPVGAISSSPTQLTVDEVHVFENCLESGDILVWVDYTIKYASTPAELSSDTYLIRMINSTTGLDVRDAQPYAYFNSGYSAGTASLYFTKDDVASLGLLWNPVPNPYYISLTGNPTAAWDGAIPSAPRFQGNNFVYEPRPSTIGITQATITSYLLGEAAHIQSVWATPAYYQLLTPTASGGVVLSAQGQQYFSVVLPNLSMLAPNGLLTPANSALLLATTLPVTTTQFAKTISVDMQGSSMDLSSAAASLHVGGMWLGIILTMGITFFVVMHGFGEM